MRYQAGMSYNVSLPCGCVVYVACHPQTGIAHTRVLERRHPLCQIRSHEVGVRLTGPDPPDQAKSLTERDDIGLRRATA